MKFFSLNVASYIANLCKKNCHEYNNTKIQKLLYCSYGCVLAIYNQRLCDEYPRAWKYGPVFPRVFSYISKGRDILVPCPSLNAGDELLALLENVVNTFGAYSASALSTWTHQAGSPWDVVVNAMNDQNGIIPDDLISEYFAANVVVRNENA